MGTDPSEQELFLELGLGVQERRENLGGQVILKRLEAATITNQ